MKDRILQKLHRFRSLTLVLVTLLALCAFPVTAFALEGSTGGLSWSLSAGTLTVSGSGPMQDYTDAKMPPWYDSAEEINRIVVKEGVTSIGDLAFYGCEAASVASLPSSVTSIGARAFKNCTALSQINLPAGLVSIGEAAFESCESLRSIALPGSLQTIGSYAFMRCSSLTSVTIPASVTDLGMVTFAYCTGLTRAEILCPLTKLPDWTFYGCRALNAVSLPETVTETGEYAFEKCSQLNHVYYDGTGTVDTSGAGESTEVRPTEEFPASGSSQNPDPSGESTVTEKVTTSDNAVITETTTTDYSYTLNGRDATLEEVLASTDQDAYTVDTSTTTTISASLNNSDGWDELADRVNAALKNQDGTVEVEVQLPDSKVSGEDLAKLAGKDVTLTVTTPEGSAWKLDESKLTEKDFSDKQYELDYSVKKTDEKKSGIEGDAVYQIQFADDIPFRTTVGIQVGNARQYATLYEKKNAIQTVIVDDKGYAWFSLEDVDAGKNYYVGINTADADRTEALIPTSLQEEYGIDATLTDEEGTHYQVTGRSSRWGITGKEFAIYVAIAVVLVILMVAGIMFTIHKFAKMKAQYALPKEDEEPMDIDEEALRMQVMQELLEEAEKKNNEGKKQ